MSITCGDGMTEMMDGLRDLLGLPDEMYQELNIFISVNDAVRIEAKFIAKGKLVTIKDEISTSKEIKIGDEL